MSAWPKKGIHYSKKAAESVGAVQVSVLRFQARHVHGGRSAQAVQVQWLFGFRHNSATGPGRSFGSLNGLSL